MNDLQHQAENPPDYTPSTTQEARRLLGERVRDARMAAHLAQRELAGQDFSKTYMSAVERGKMTPSFQALGILAARLGVTVSNLLGEEVRKPDAEAPEAPAEGDERAARLREGERVLQEGRYEEAIALFEHAGEPERANQAREAYAQFLAEQGRYHEAYEQLRLAQAITGRATNAL
jgi:transcriptional regulator with XRE-family HTH domain